MSLSIGDKVFLVIALADFAGIFLWLGICLHLAHTKLELWKCDDSRNATDHQQFPPWPPVPKSRPKCDYRTVFQVFQDEVQFCMGKV